MLAAVGYSGAGQLTPAAVAALQQGPSAEAAKHGSTYAMLVLTKGSQRYLEGCLARLFSKARVALINASSPTLVVAARRWWPMCRTSWCSRRRGRRGPQLEEPA